MSSKPPSSNAPAGTPPPGNGKFLIIGVLLLAGAGGLAYKFLGSGDDKHAGTPPAPTVSVPPPISHKDDDYVPPPPPVVDAAPPEVDAGGAKVTSTGGGGNPCAGPCYGKSTSDLEVALGMRARAARRCYENALKDDPTLKGRISLKVKVASTGQVCSANVASDELGNAAVSQCAARTFVGGNMPAPSGGCVEATVPISFIPQGQH